MARKHKTALWIGALLLISGLAACATVKPLRVVAPETFGLTCVSETLCLDDQSRTEAALALAEEGLAFVSTELGPLERSPRFLFCSTRACFSRFGNPEVAALYVFGLEAVIINEIGWLPHILRHEVIHHWQQERFGGARAMLRLPRWYIEGMAYVLSQDPRPEIPHPDAQAQRETFQAWLAEGNDWRVPPGDGGSATPSVSR